MKISKPFADYRTRFLEELPIWFFEDCQLPNVDYNNLIWTAECNAGELLDDPIYKKRLVARWEQNYTNPIFVSLEPVVKNIIENIKNTCPIESLSQQWPYNTWDLKNFYFVVKKDIEGFQMDNHLDNRNIKWTFIMNIEDNIDSTTFYVNERTVKGPTQKGSGVFYFNHHELLHSIGPIQKDRFILFYMNVIQ